MKPTMMLMLFLMLGTTFMSPALADEGNISGTVGATCATAIAEPFYQGYEFQFNTDKSEYLPGETIRFEAMITAPYHDYEPIARARIHNPDGSITVVNMDQYVCSTTTCGNGPTHCQYSATHTIPYDYTGPIQITGVGKVNGERLTEDVTVFFLPNVPIEPEPVPPYMGKAEIRLYKGWNLISLPGTGHIRAEPYDLDDPIIFVWLPQDQRYLTLQEFENHYGHNGGEDFLSTHSFWVYAREATVLFYEGEFASYSGKEIFHGWNFLAHTKDMSGHTLEQIEGTANIQRAYRWNAGTQEWRKIATHELLQDYNAFEGILVYSSNHGYLDKVNGYSEPPEFPE